ncbi:MAG: hypothetical protein GY727_04330 [Gammaproteobacteria bacterium]|nr:hypothetical protein [Gammaproteobacteria bacterium]MCP4090067.1 hypothetical protein [Gammaproteobacteria bacterium]MCP4277043.1 hypothetical protein [Gammaproteobacteria bacterium]MCP4832734.1 hypothetical protein [Gammaproteobacteria bacterium]MCP4929927.1 hypothetical protein [Gammaproteobacteria bacterium]
MYRLVKHPLVWFRLFFFFWSVYALVTLFLGRWTELLIALLGLLAVHMIEATIRRRRRKNIAFNHQADYDFTKCTEI